MERNTLGTFLWITVTAIVMLSLIAFASPFGVYVRDSVDTFTGEYIDSNTTDEPIDTLVYTIKVKYEVPADSSITPPSEERTYKEGETFKILPPTITGFTPDKDKIEGIATKDAEFVISYTYAKYNITFDTNAGDWVDAYSPPNSYIFKSAVSLPDGTKLMRLNYTFAGWYEDKALTKPANDIKSTDHGDKTYYAKWNPTAYTITYYLNDTTGLDNQYYHDGEPRAEWSNEINLNNYSSFKYGEQVEFPVAVNKFGYTFKGWSTEKSGADKSKYRTQTTESDNENIVLYAQWERKTYNIYYHLDFTSPLGEKKTYQITTNGYKVINAKGVEITESHGYPTKYTYGDTITLPDISLTGYDQYATSATWYDKKTTQITITGAGVMTNSSLISGHPSGMTQRKLVSPTDHSDIYVYVKPIPNNYYITFNKNAPDTIRPDTNTNMSKQTFVYDYASKLNGNSYSYTGYTFAGWNTKPDGSGTAYSDKQSVVNLTAKANETITLYAQWTKNDVNVVYKYYFENIAGNGYDVNTSRQANITVKYKADTTERASNYLKDFTGFTRGKTVQYDALLGEEKDLGTNNSFYVLPDGKTEIRIYYERNSYTLTFKVTPGDMFKTASATASNMSGISLTTGSNATARTATRTVMFEDKITFTATYESQHKSGGWTQSHKAGTTSGNSLEVTMPAENITITLTNLWNTATITFNPNDSSGDPKSSWNGATKSDTFTYGEKYNPPGFPSISRNCYTFLGWYTAASGGTAVGENETFDYGDSVTLYAHWEYVPISVNASMHEMEVTDTKTATCTEAGYVKKKCKYCGKTTQDNTAALGHLEPGTTVSQAATCTSAGYIKRTCNRGSCGHVLENTTVPMISHAYTAQCNTIHNTNHSEAINWGNDKNGNPNHTCITGTISGNYACYRHQTCYMCAKKSGRRYCITHGVGSGTHKVAGGNCKRNYCANNAPNHNCKTNGYNATHTTSCS